MAERLDEWPRVHSCLRNWCPERRDDCKTCDAVCALLIASDKKERENAGKPS